jgi:hypothetical protein
MWKKARDVLLILGFIAAVALWAWLLFGGNPRPI